MRYSELKAMLLNTLKAEEDTTYSDALLYDALCLAQDELLPWIPKRTMAVVSASQDQDSFKLPADCYQLDSVQDVKSGTFLNRAQFLFGEVRNSSANARAGSFDWAEYPQGTLYLSSGLSNGQELRLYYSAYYKRPSSKTDDGFELEFPRCALAGVLYWACSHALLPQVVSAARVGQFKQKVDSGRPTDNPLADVSKLYRAYFLEAMKALPKSAGATR